MRTLGALARQSIPGTGMEVVVVDDGSTDDTLEELERLRAGFPVPLSVLASPRRGPAGARNTGIAAAAGDVVLLLGDDTLAADAHLVARHAGLHEARPDRSYAVLGRVAWAPDRPVSELMRWLEAGGPQFAFGSLAPGPVAAARYLYSSHVSLKRDLLDAVGGFDARFPHAAVEDTELGVRLAAAGLALDYHPELLVLHDHPTTLAQSLARMRAVGRSAALFSDLHPGHRHPDVAAPRDARWQLARRLGWSARPLARIRVPLALRRRAWRMLHRAAYAHGWRAGRP